MAANNAPNLKVVVGADTSQFDKGMRAAKAELRDFSKVSSDALGKLGDAIGVNTAQIEKVTNAIGGLGQKLSQAGGEGAQAFGSLLSSVTKLNAGLVGLGLAGVLATFKALNAEAANFKSTVAGANIALQTQAYTDTYRQFLHDTNSETGKAVAEWQANWQKGAARLGANIQKNFVTSISGNGTFFQTAFPLLGTFFGGRGDREGAAAAAERAEQIQGRLYELTRQESDATREISDLNERIAKNREVMRDAQNSLNDRLDAYRAILDDIDAKAAIQLPIEQERTQLMDEMVDLTGSAPAQVDAANQQYVKQQSLTKQLTDEKAALLRYANSLTSQENKNNAALQKQLTLQQQIAQSKADLRSLDLSTSGSLSAGATTGLGGGLILPEIDTTALQAQLNAALGDSLFLEVGVQIEKGSLFDLSQQVTSILTGLTESMSAAIGGLVGDLLTGGDAWGNFANAALSAFGDMATAVGKIAIECGVASLGIKAALTNLGPAGAAIAIAAGTALVALGAAVKSGLSNVAAGNYSSSASVASGSYGSSVSNDYVTRDVQVNVTGTLQADGDKLVAVLNNTANKKGYTT